MYGPTTVEGGGPAFAFTVFAEGVPKAGETCASLLFRRRNTGVESDLFRMSLGSHRSAMLDDERWNEVGLRVISRCGWGGCGKVEIL